MLTTSHPFYPQFRALIQEASSLKPILDLGTSKRFAKEVGLVRDLIEEQSYFAGGFRPDFTIQEPCDFHCDIQKMPEIEEASVGSVLCMSVLEHVENPIKAVREVNRILKPGGVFIGSAPFLISYHGKRSGFTNPLYLAGANLDTDHSHNNYGDFWRFTHEGLVHLFREAGFSCIDVWPVDGRIILRLQMLGLYYRLASIPLVSSIINWLDRPRLGKATSLHFIRAYK